MRGATNQTLRARVHMCTTPAPEQLHVVEGVQWPQEAAQKSGHGASLLAEHSLSHRGSGSAPERAVNASRCPGRMRAKERFLT